MSGVRSAVRGATARAAARATLAACFLGMFVVTLDAVALNVALPSIRDDLGGGMTGLQWVVDAYVLALAALLLSAGALADRIGANRAFALGMVLFALASGACGLAPNLPTLIAARAVKGIGAAFLMPTSMSLISHAYADPLQKARAVGIWALGGAVASSSGPVLGGALTMVGWRWIFLINVPVGILALVLLRRAPAAPRQHRRFDLPGLVLGLIAFGSLTFAAIESGAMGLTAAPVLAAAAIAVVAGTAFIIVERRTAQPMLPMELFASPTVSAIAIVGFAFMACFYGTPFVMSLYLQQLRGLSPIATGMVFLPMMLIGLLLTPFSARIVERFGSRLVISVGFVIIAAGTAGLALIPAASPIWLLSLMLFLVGLGGPFVMPPATAALLNAVPQRSSGTASGLFNTSRQVGGALAIGTFGALLGANADVQDGLRLSMLLATAVALLAAATTARWLTDRRRRH